MCNGKGYPLLLAAGVLLIALLATLAPAGAQTDRPLYLPLVTGGAGTPVPNGDFESGRTVWVESSRWEYVLIVPDQDLPRGISPHGGTWAAWLGGETNEQASIEQPVFVDPQYPYLAYWHWLDWPDSCDDTGEALFTVSLGGTVLAQTDVCDTTTTGGWVHAVLDAGAFAGQTATLRFQLTTMTGNFANVFLDDVTLQAAP